MFSREDIGKSFARVDMYDAKSELGYQARRGGVAFVLRRIANFAARMIEGSADILAGFVTDTVGATLQSLVGAEIARDIGAFAGAFGSKIIGLAGMGLAAGVSAGFTQVDYNHQKENIKNLYKHEAAAKLHKPADQVTVADIETLAKDNPVLDEELKRAKRQRNFGVPLAIVTTLASFAVATVLLPAILPASALAGVGGFLIKAAVSWATYYAVKTPLQHIGNTYVGLYAETANDHIVGLKRCHDKHKAVSPEQVLAVFAMANPGLGALIEKEFGKPYSQLSEEDQKHAVEKVRTFVPLEKFAQDINTGAVQAMELAFAASGQMSGVKRAAVGAAYTESCTAADEKTASYQEKIGTCAKVSHTERIAREAEGLAALGAC